MLAPYLILKREERLTEEQHAYLERLQQIDRQVAAAYRLTQEFARMIRELEGERLDEWLEDALL